MSKTSGLEISVKDAVRALLRCMSNASESMKAMLQVLVRSRVSINWKSRRGYRDCFVLGNGPSLSDDIKAIVEYRDTVDIWCVNDFSLTEYYSLLRPTCYVIVDPFYWDEDLPSPALEQRDHFFHALEEKTQWKLNLFVPFDCQRSPVWRRRGGVHNANVAVEYF